MIYSRFNFCYLPQFVCFFFIFGGSFCEIDPIFTCFCTRFSTIFQVKTAPSKKKKKRRANNKKIVFELLKTCAQIIHYYTSLERYF